MALVFPPKSEEEFSLWLSYQQAELLALPLIPKAVKLNSKVIPIPEEVRVSIAQAEDFLSATGPAISSYLFEHFQNDFMEVTGQFQPLPY